MVRTAEDESFGDPLTFHLRHHEIWKTIGWITLKFGSDIYVPHKVNCNNFGDPFIFDLASSVGQKFSLSNSLVYD